MTSKTSQCSSSPSFDEDREDYISVNYWTNYSFSELIEDIKCTVYENYSATCDIKDALRLTAEDADIEFLTDTHHHSSIVVTYKPAKSLIETTIIRFENSSTS